MWTQWQGCTAPSADWRGEVFAQGSIGCLNLHVTPHWRQTGWTTLPGSKHPSSHNTRPASPPFQRPWTSSLIVCQMRRDYFNCSGKTTQILKMWATGLCEWAQPHSLSVMPAWTTGGTDVICERETDMSGEGEWERWREREEEGETGEGRETEREGEEERCNEARLQGWTQSVSLPPFFQYPLLMKFHLDCKCSVIYHHKCVMGPWIQWHCAG